MARIVFVVFLMFSMGAYAVHQRMNLQEALFNKYVTAKASSLGGYQGICMSVSLKNNTKDSLVVIVEAGRRLNSMDDVNQDILVTRQEVIALRTGEQKQVNIKGYCCQASRHCPPRGAKYDLNTLADSNLVKLARFLNFKEFEKNAEQEAVWAISDKRSSANITSENDSLTQSLRSLVAAIKGEELPWYRIFSKKYVYASGAIVNVNLRLQGLLSYSNERDSYATLFVKDEKGTLVCLVKSEWLKMASSATYKIDLPVLGLPKGKYTIELNTSSKQLAKRTFEI